MEMQGPLFNNDEEFHDDNGIKHGARLSTEPAQLPRSLAHEASTAREERASALQGWLEREGQAFRKHFR